MLLKFKISWDQFCILPRMKKSIHGIVSYQNFFMSFCITLRRKLQHVGHKWVIHGKLTPRMLCGSVGLVVNRYDPHQALHFITCFSGCHPQTKIFPWMWSVFLIDHMFLRKWHWCLVPKWVNFGSGVNYGWYNMKPCSLATIQNVF